MTDTSNWDGETLRFVGCWLGFKVQGFNKYWRPGKQSKSTKAMARVSMRFLGVHPHHRYLIERLIRMAGNPYTAFFEGRLLMLGTWAKHKQNALQLFSRTPGRVNASLSAAESQRRWKRIGKKFGNLAAASSRCWVYHPGSQGRSAVPS